MTKILAVRVVIIRNWITVDCVQYHSLLLGFASLAQLASSPLYYTTLEYEDNLFDYLSLSLIQFGIALVLKKPMSRL